MQLFVFFYFFLLTKTVLTVVILVHINNALILVAEQNTEDHRPPAPLKHSKITPSWHCHLLLECVHVLPCDELSLYMCPLRILTIPCQGCIQSCSDAGCPWLRLCCRGQVPLSSQGSPSEHSVFVLQSPDHFPRLMNPL